LGVPFTTGNITILGSPTIDKLGIYSAGANIIGVSSPVMMVIKGKMDNDNYGKYIYL